MSDQIGALLKSAQEGNQGALARLLTALEKGGSEPLIRHRELLSPTSPALRVGLTGPPGSGKSTLVGCLLKRLITKNLKVGVLAVDPSSPFTSGAILGDRIRYADFASHKNIFVRSLGTRGSLGGLSAAAYLMLRAFDACEFDLVLIETVGVGQSELDVMYVADDIVVVLVPESGDSVQALKAGLLEVADLFIVNKADRPGAKSLVSELQFISETSPDPSRKPEVIETIATQDEGVDHLYHRIESMLKRSGKRNRSNEKRLQHEAIVLAKSEVEASLRARASQIHSVASFETFLRELV